MTVTRRTLQVGLAALWLLDGALQCQKFMFTKAFGRTVIAPTGQGQPGFVSHPVHFAATIVIDHPVATNVVFAAAQLGIGLGLLWRRSVRFALTASVVWGVAVWYVGEGLGGLTTGETLLTGAPGAALLYAVIALVAFPDRDNDSAIAPSGWAIPAWIALWLTAAGLQLTAGNNTGASIAATFRHAGPASPHLLARIDHHLGSLHISNDYAAGLIAADVLIAVWTLVPGRARQTATVTGAALAAGCWVLVQGLGDLTTGRATDPNSGPLIALLALAVLGTQTTLWAVPTDHTTDSADLAIAATTIGTGSQLVARNVQPFPMFAGLEPPY
jgi:hypothetical protein